MNAPSPFGIYIWAPLGGGHKTAKDGVKTIQVERGEVSQTVEGNAEGRIFRVVPVNEGKNDIDITKFVNLGPLRFGDWTAKMWNDAQMRGDLGTLQRIALPISVRVSEFFMGWIVRLRFKAMLRGLKTPPRHIVSAQAFCIKDIARAIASVNKEKGWDMQLEVYLTDLPSKRATHFFPSMKRLASDPELSRITKLYAKSPRLKKGVSEKKFWRDHCGEITVVTDQPFPIRAAFRNTEALGEKLKQPILDVTLILNQPCEKKIIENHESCEVKEKEVVFHLKPQDKVGFLMLGSQPTQEAVLSWLQTFVKARGEKKFSDGRQHYLFLYCGAPKEKIEQNPLLAAVHAEIEKMKKAGQLPDDVHIVPFTNQGPDFIASLMGRSDMSITRSGGATSMELLTLGQSPHIPKRENKCTFIHSEALMRLDDAHILEKLQAHLERLAFASPTDAYWNDLYKEMSHACRAMGISEAECEVCFQTAKSEKKTVAQILADVDALAARASKESVSRRKKIDHKMSALRTKDKYKNHSESDLRRVATEKLLLEEGVILWEGKNARYLQESLQDQGVRVVNPEFAREDLSLKFFS